jgi:transcriptional regulator with XRE-family HTH domain
MRQIRNQALIDEVAAKIKKLREARHITQEVFYNDTRIHLARIETGKVNITISTLEAICKYLGVSLQEFFFEDEKGLPL